nr:hypothetical protein [uncultured Undibacterium sp.]
MKTCIHPSYQKSLQRKFIFIWSTCAISFGAGLFFHKSGFEFMGWLLFGLFGILIFGGLGYLFFSHFHVNCLSCNGKTKTIKDSTNSKWLAVCSRCQIEWDLQTSVSSD